MKYVIVVQGSPLTENWEGWYKGIILEAQPRGKTKITGEFKDQSALLGIINALCNFGYILCSVFLLEEE